MPWAAAQADRIAEACGADPRKRERPDDTWAGRFAGFGKLPYVRRQLPWSRSVPVETHLANLTSHSAFLVADPDATEDFRTRERALLSGLFPDGMVEEAYVVDLLVLRRP